MSLEEFEKKLVELEKLQAEAENAHAELKAQIAELKARGEEKPKPPHPRWMPMRDEKYWLLDSEPVTMTWDNDICDVNWYEIGNVFLTKEAATFTAERLKVLAEMREWAGHNYDGAYIYYHRPSDEIMINWDGNSTYCFGDIRFKCVDDAENCVKAVGADRIKKYYFMIPEEETNNG